MAEIVIVGPGAMGCLHAALLADAGVDVALLDYRPERARQLAAQDVVLRWDKGERRVAVRVSAEPESLGPARYVVMMVKCYSTRAAARHAQKAATASTVWVTLQNGLGNVEAMRDEVAGARILAGTTTSGANLAGPGIVNVAAVGDTVVGPAVNARRADAAAFAEVWSRAAPCEALDDPWPAVWRKLVVNAAINPVAALARKRNGELMRWGPLRRLAFAVAREVAEAARSEGVDLGAEFDPEQAVELVCALTASNRCSMLQDLEAGRRTEIEFINGAVARRADAPLCQALTVLVKAAEAVPLVSGGEGLRA